MSDEFYCDFCGRAVAEDDADIRWDPNDIYIMCPDCSARARQLEESMAANEQRDEADLDVEAELGGFGMAGLGSPGGLGGGGGSGAGLGAGMGLGLAGGLGLGGLGIGGLGLGGPGLGGLGGFGAGSPAGGPTSRAGASGPSADSEAAADDDLDLDLEDLQGL
ncbi:MAG: hypothetical protein HY329_16820 [Chloroflexi bacterium]|nr:hypothetical protein [Chloroflexota bacterium]